LERVQRKGIGTVLLRKLANQLVHDGFKSMAVWVLASNTSSRFYENIGAHRVISKEIEIGGVLLPVAAYGWPNLGAIVSDF
jgi:GNAT superfamily N-acetyltransferase